MTTFEQLRSATANLTRSERLGILDGATSARDRRVADREHRVANFWNLLAVFVAEVEDEQRRTLADLERRLD